MYIEGYRVQLGQSREEDTTEKRSRDIYWKHCKIAAQSHDTVTTEAGVF